MKKVCVNIELSLPTEESKQISKLAAILKEKYPQTTYYMSGGQIPPHLTLHYLYISSSKKDDLIHKTAEIFKRIKKPKLQLAKVEVYRNKIFSIPVTINKELFDLHQKIVVNLESVRNGFIDPDLLIDFKKRPHQYQSNVKAYGYPYVLKQFRPHVALARVVTTESFENLEQTRDEINKHWRPVTIVTGVITIRSWESGQGIGKILAEYQLI